MDRRVLLSSAETQNGFKGLRKSIRRFQDFRPKERNAEHAKSSIKLADLLPRTKGKEYSEDAIKLRRKWLQHKTGVSLNYVGSYKQDTEEMRGCVENMIGLAQIPIGIAGPLNVNGEYAKGNFYIPMATTEGTHPQSSFTLDALWPDEGNRPD